MIYVTGFNPKINVALCSFYRQDKKEENSVFEQDIAIYPTKQPTKHLIYGYEMNLTLKLVLRVTTILQEV